MAYAPNKFDLDHDLRVWTDKRGAVVGVAHYLARERNPELFLMPAWYAESDQALGDEMASWVRDRALRDGVKEVETSCVKGFAEKEAFLERHGFHCFGDPYVFMERSIKRIPDLPTLPVDYEFSPGDPDTPLPGITRSTDFDSFSSVATAPFYRPDLAIRVAYQAREIAAGCICWLDEAGSVAEFEPVGSVEAHRRKGLASAVIVRALHRLRELGVSKAVVRTDDSNLPAVALYERLGFKTTARELGWSLTIE